MSTTTQRTPLTDVVLTSTDEGKRGPNQGTRLDNGTRTLYLALRAAANLNVTVAGAAVLNRGSIWAAIRQIVLVEGGKDVWTMDARMARFMAELQSASALFATRVAAAGVASTDLEEASRIFFASPLTISPFETHYRERNINKRLELQFERRVSAADALVSGGTKVLGDLTVEVEQVHDPWTNKPPVFVPLYREIAKAISSANDDETIDIETSRWLRWLTVMQEDTDGESSAIINAIGLRSDAREIIGPKLLPWDQAVLDMEAEFGGDVVGNRSMWAYHFAQSGRLGNVLNPSEDPNLRLRLNVQPAGANSIVRVGLLELTRIPGVTSQGAAFAA